MAEELVRFSLGEGAAGVYVEVPADDPEVVRARQRDGRTPRVVAGFEAGLDQVREVAARTLERIVALPRPPSSVELEFGVNFSVEAGAVIARTGIEGHLKVKVVWEREPARGGPSEDDDDDSGPGDDDRPSPAGASPVADG